MPLSIVRITMNAIPVKLRSIPWDRQNQCKALIVLCEAVSVNRQLKIVGLPIGWAPNQAVPKVLLDFG